MGICTTAGLREAASFKLVYSLFSVRPYLIYDHPVKGRILSFSRIYETAGPGEGEHNESDGFS